MPTISILPDGSGVKPATYVAVSDGVSAAGRTVGEALDAVSERLGTASEPTLVIVQPMGPDQFFGEASRRRLAELMHKWRAARDAGGQLPPEEQAELDALTEQEVRAAGERAADMLRRLPS